MRVCGGGETPPRQCPEASCGALLQIYFRLNNMRLGKALIKSVEADGSNTFERYKMSQKVTYNYFLGMPPSME